MSNKDEEQIFDFMAAAEDTGKRLDTLLKTIPGTLHKTLSTEYQRSPWLTIIPAEVERLSGAVKSSEAAAERTKSAAAHMESKIKSVCRVACLAAIIMPLVTLGIACWYLLDLRGEQVQLEQRNAELASAITTATQTETRLAEKIARQKSEIEKLSATSDTLKAATGGLDVVDNGDGSWDVVFPASAEFERRPWWRFDGRYVIPFSISGK